MKDYNLLAQTIYKRKSVRTFIKKSIGIKKDTNILEAFNIEPLVKDIKVNIKLLKKEEIWNTWSNYCFAFYSEDKPYHLENIGFIGQQLDLTLQSKGIGSCWWGLKKPKSKFKKSEGLDCIITMAAGIPQNPEIRNYPESFNRKSPKDIVIGDTNPDDLIKAVSIAPSAMNMQPWLIEKNGGKYSFYLRNPINFIERMATWMRNVDMGIALAHFYIQAKADGHTVSFGFEGNDINQGKFIADINIS